MRRYHHVGIPTDVAREGEVYLEDFEGVDSSNFITLSRLAWFWASSPAEKKRAITIAIKRTVICLIIILVFEV